MVAPFTGAWIETSNLPFGKMSSFEVAPFTGAWIETKIELIYTRTYTKSHPSRVRGLKHYDPVKTGLHVYSRTLHGCVD